MWKATIGILGLMAIGYVELTHSGAFHGWSEDVKAAPAQPAELTQALLAAKAAENRSQSQIQAMRGLMGEINESGRAPVAKAPAPPPASNSAGLDPAALERIRAMKVPDDVKSQIIRNYQATGVMPLPAGGQKPEDALPGRVEAPHGGFVEASSSSISAEPPAPAPSAAH